MTALSISNLDVSVGKPILNGLTLDVPASEAKKLVAISLEGSVG
ncbi:hypothetical protein [Brevundimonas vitis]|nr:hypothetical protein [Brevundimonas vitisensis]